MENSEGTARPEATTVTRMSPAFRGIRVSNVVKRYGSRVILDGISLEINQGSAVALCGSSGAGKTTLVRIICGLLGFEAGEICVAGSGLPPLTVRAGQKYPRLLYGKIGVVFQEHNLFPHMTALENVRFAPRHVFKFTKAEATERAMHELERMGLTGKTGEYPSRLSGGERQRVAIARALAFDPVLLLLDEPTSNLDPSVIGEVLGIIGKLSAAGTTMLVITHNIRFAGAVGDRFAILSHGKLDISDDTALLSRMESPW